MAFRVDLASKFSPPRKTAEGFLVADALPTRAGIFLYRRSDGKVIRELRAPHEVFADESLASLSAACLTSGHPDAFVTSSNASGLSVGHLGEAVSKSDDGMYVQARVYVKDAGAIAAIESGTVQELSCGYECVVDETPGVWEGQPYDTIQRNIRYNHVALVPAGRAGPECRIRLDSIDAVEIEKPQHGAHNVQKIRIDGVDYEVSEAASQAFAKFAEQNAKVAADLQKQTARADALEEASKKAAEELKQAQDPKRFDEAVEAKFSLRLTAEKAEVKCDNLTDEKIRCAVIEKVVGLKCDGKDAAYIAAAFDIAVAELAKKNVADLRRDSANAQTTTSVSTAAQRVAAARERQANLYKQPLSGSK